MLHPSLMYASRVFELITVEDYLEGEKKASCKHEFIQGKVYAMAGASEAHNRIAGNVFAQLWGKLPPDCAIYMSDMKLRVKKSIFYYPDVMIVCEKDAANKYYKENPCLIIEVLSTSTKNTDRREKLDLYMTIPSLQSYVLIDSQKHHVTGYYRQGSIWEERVWDKGIGKVEFTCAGTELSLDDIYKRLTE